MRSQPRPEQLVDAVLGALVDSGCRLVGADLAVLAAGPAGRLTVRAAAGRRPALAGDRPADAPAGAAARTRSPVREAEPGQEGLLVPVRLSAAPAGGLVVSPAGAEEPGAYAIAGSARDSRVLLVLAGALPSPPDERVVRHLLGTASAALAAELPAVFSTIRDYLHEREEERRRWARELHDETLQQLGALQVLLTSALAKAPTPEEAPQFLGLVQAVRLATELVATQIGSLRQLITELRPAALDDLGLTPPLQALARRTEQLSGIRVTLHVSLRYAEGTAGTRLLPDVELAVYRVVQEALTNIRRHSTATRASVTVVEEDDVVVAEISDDGQGFDAERAAGFGLEGMRERAELAEGTLEVTAARPDGRGTTVRLVVPARHR